MESTLAQIINDLIVANQTIAARDEEIVQLKAEIQRLKESQTDEHRV